MDWELMANRNGHIACTHGGESLAGLVAANRQGIADQDDIAVIKSTAHALKFAGFQEMYFEQHFPPEFNIRPDPDLINAPVYVQPGDLEFLPAFGKPLKNKAFKLFVRRVSEEIAGILDLKKRSRE
jgi:threonine synthase